MKRLITMVFCALLVCNAAAQNQTLISETDSLPSLVERIYRIADSTRTAQKGLRHIKSHINLEFAASANAYIRGGRFDELSFKMNRVRLEMYGQISKHLYYNFRQSFNKYSNPYELDNIASSIEYANISWKPSSRFKLIAGKQFVTLGGYEYYVNSLRVREFSDFNSSVSCYQTGLTGIFDLSPSQQLILQVANNRSGSDDQLFVYGRPSELEKSRIPLLATVNWNGFFADRAVQLRYAASIGGLAKGKSIYYLTAGNIYEKGPVIAYFDVMYSRQGVDSQGRVSLLQDGVSEFVTAKDVQYLTMIANFDYAFHPKWNAYIKGVYETAGVYRENGSFAAGKYLTSWNAQACLEWFPFTEDKGFKVFLHYLYKGKVTTEITKSLRDSLPDLQRISMGIVYVIPVL